MGVPRRTLAMYVALIAGLIAAFVFAPPVLAGAGPGGGFADHRHFTGAVRQAFAEYWHSGDSPGLAGVVDYWFRYHLVKALIAAALLTVLIVLGVRLRRSALAVVTLLAALSLITLMANVQGVIAPFASLLPMVVDGAPGGPPAAPAYEAMISDFARYHVAMVVIAATVAVVLIGLSVLWWRRSARALGIATGVFALVLIVVAVANTTVAADPEPALAALFNGGW